MMRPFDEEPSPPPLVESQPSVPAIEHLAVNSVNEIA
jgi:hypothetical protein